VRASRNSIFRSSAIPFVGKLAPAVRSEIDAICGVRVESFVFIVQAHEMLEKMQGTSRAEQTPRDVYGECDRSPSWPMITQRSGLFIAARLVDAEYNNAMHREGFSWSLH
jgi:hypothetical protein